MGVIRDWANRNFREEEARPDSFLERFRGPELQTVTTQQGDGKGDKDGEGKGTKYNCPACGAQRAPKHIIAELSGVSSATARGRPGAMSSSVIIGKGMDRNDLLCF